MNEEKKVADEKQTNNAPYDAWGKFSLDKSDTRLIEGPQKRLQDIRMLSSISIEFVKGFRAFYQVGPCATFFGSARFLASHQYYKLARQTASLVSRAGFTIMTGGGPGIMEAANRGARDVHGPSLGCNIILPHEQKPNAYLDNFVEFKHFFIRKVMLLRYSYAFVVLPGGFGTLDEVFETLTLIQTKKISDFPIVLMGKEFFGPMKNFITDTLLKNRTILEEDASRLNFTDDPDEALACILSCTEKKFGLKSLMPRKNCGHCE